MVFHSGNLLLEGPLGAGRKPLRKRSRRGLGSFVEANSARRKMPVAKLLLPAHNANLFRGGGRRSSSSLSSSLDRARHHVLITIIVVCNGISGEATAQELACCHQEASMAPRIVTSTLDLSWESPAPLGLSKATPRAWPSDHAEGLRGGEERRAGNHGDSLLSRIIRKLGLAGPETIRNPRCSSSGPN